jgi:glutamate synthase (NADPH/NADH) small chain
MCKEPPTERSEKVAIIGAGPAGLTAASYLRCKGFKVHIYEANPEPGGLMIIGIPGFRINKPKIKQNIEGIKKLGVVFYTNARVCDDCKHTWEDIFNTYDAVLIATGASTSKRLKIPGAELEGIYGASEWLIEYSLVELGYKPKEELPDPGSVSAVIGGGLTAYDQVEALLRAGVEVYWFYRRSIDEAPAGRKQIEQLISKGAKFFEFTLPKRYIGKAGKITEIEIVKTRYIEPPKEGRKGKLTTVEGTETTYKVDSVFEAIGEAPNIPFTNPEKYGIKLTDWGTILVDENWKTTRDRVYAAGDVAIGPSNISKAMMSGKNAAIQIERLLEGIVTKQGK